MSITAQLLTRADDTVERRLSSRTPVAVQAGFRKSGLDAAKAEVSNLSRTGCKVDSAINLREKMQVWIKFPGLQAMPAKVVWVNGFEAGCEFSSPFYEPVLENFLSRHKTA